MKKVLCVFLACVLMLTLFAACGDTATTATTTTESEASYSAENPLVLRVSAGYTDEECKSNPPAMGIKWWMDEITERTDGRIVFEFYGGGQLGGTTQEYVTGCQTLSFEVCNNSVGNFSSYTDAWAGLNVPFLFANQDCVREFLKTDLVQEMVEKSASDMGIRTICFLPAGFRNIANNKKVITSPADLKGLKFRTMNDKYQIAMMEAMGAATMTLGYTEIYSGLQQGVCDGQENPITNFYGIKLQEVQNFMSDTGHSYTFSAVHINNQIWDSITAEDQAIILECSDECVDYILEKMEAKEAEIIKDCVENYGMTYTELTMEQKQAFRDACEPVYEQLKEDLGEDYFNRIMDTEAEIEEKLGL